MVPAPMKDGPYLVLDDLRSLLSTDSLFSLYLLHAENDR